MKIKNCCQKQNIAVIYGGQSVEHDISTITGVQVLNNLDKDKFNIIPIYINKQGQFLTGENFFDINTYSNNFSKIKSKELILSWKNKGIYFLKNKGAKQFLQLDFVFLALHGGMGENGSIQGFLNLCDIPFSSCDVLGSSISMDKYITKLVCKSLNIETTNFVLLDENDRKELFADTYKKLEKLSFPIIVKPNSSGSSIGISFCKNKMQLKNAISLAFKFDSFVLCEEAVENLREFNLAIMGNNFDCEYSDIEEVCVNKDFLTFENKYMNSKSSSKGMETMGREVPAKIPTKLSSKIIDYGISFFKNTKLSGCVRIDFLYDDKTEQLFLNEVNSIPGSIANYLWKSKKYTFKQLLEKIMFYSLSGYKLAKTKVKHFDSSVLKFVSSSQKLVINK